jgi:hypothetical protein
VGATFGPPPSRLDPERIVAKRKEIFTPRDTSWYKIKNKAYTQAEGRWEPVICGSRLLDSLCTPSYISDIIPSAMATRKPKPLPESLHAPWRTPYAATSPLPTDASSRLR